MSNNTVSASATGLPTPPPELSAALDKLAEARAKDCPLSALKDAQRRAWTAFEEISNYTDYIAEDDPSYAVLEAEWTRRDMAETAAMIAVMAYPARTLDEAKSKARFLLEQTRG